MNIDKGTDKLLGNLITNIERVNAETTGKYSFVAPWRENYPQNDKLLLLLVLTKILIKDNIPSCTCSKYFKDEQKIQMATTLAVSPLDQQKLAMIRNLATNTKQEVKVCYHELLADAIEKSIRINKRNQSRIKMLLVLEKKEELLDQLLTKSSQFCQFWSK